MNEELGNPSTVPELPETGDETHVNIFIIGLVISILGVFVLTYKKKKYENLI